MKITKNFDLKDLTVTNTGLLNVMPLDCMINAMHLFIKVVQPARDYLNKPIYVDSCYRSNAVNKAVGGSSTSDHRLALAVDLTCSDNRELFSYILANLEFDQLIWEKGTKDCPAWVHVSLRWNGKNRRQVIYNY